MARRAKDSTLENRTARLKLPVQINPHHFTTLAPGIALGYRRCKGNGRWVVRAKNGKGGYWFQAFADADDYMDHDGDKVLEWLSAQDRAKELARGQNADLPGAEAPVTLDQALKDYEGDLTAHSRSTLNATWVRMYLTEAMLAKLVTVITPREWSTWRNAQVAPPKSMKPQTINRYMKGLRAALNLAARNDPRINRELWREALRNLPETNIPREYVVGDDIVLAIVAEAYAVDPAYGLLIEVLQQTGTRISQAARIRVCDLLVLDPKDPRLCIPQSKKGHRRKRNRTIVVPITKLLAAKLVRMAGKRDPNEALLLRPDGKPWAPKNKEHRDMFAKVVANVKGLAADTTMYVLRHALIQRQILGLVPLSVIAANLDTSEGQINDAYGWFINKHQKASDITRRALLDVANDTPRPRRRVRPQALAKAA